MLRKISLCAVFALMFALCVACDNDPDGNDSDDDTSADDDTSDDDLSDDDSLDCDNLDFQGEWPLEAGDRSFWIVGRNGCDQTLAPFTFDEEGSIRYESPLDSINSNWIPNASTSDGRLAVADRHGVHSFSTNDWAYESYPYSESSDSARSQFFETGEFYVQFHFSAGCPPSLGECGGYSPIFRQSVPGAALEAIVNPVGALYTVLLNNSSRSSVTYAISISEENFEGIWEYNGVEWSEFLAGEVDAGSRERAVLGDALYFLPYVSGDDDIGPANWVIPYCSYAWSDELIRTDAGGAESIFEIEGDHVWEAFVPEEIAGRDGELFMVEQFWDEPPAESVEARVVQYNIASDSADYLDLPSPYDFFCIHDIYADASDILVLGSTRENIEETNTAGPDEEPRIETTWDSRPLAWYWDGAAFVLVELPDELAHPALTWYQILGF